MFMIFHIAHIEAFFVQANDCLAYLSINDASIELKLTVLDRQ
jgi:hypothetical protein